MAVPWALVLCGPSGSGKSTLIGRLFKDFPGIFSFSVSHTTRQPRQGELPGRHYHFSNKEVMKAAIAGGEFLEWAEFSGNMYGTSKKAVEEVMASGKICVLDIDTQGVRQVKEKGLAALYVFVKPPSLAELERRLRDRNTETEVSLQRRLTIANHEMEYGAAPGNFDLVVVNDDLERAYAELKDFVVREMEKRGADDSSQYFVGFSKFFWLFMATLQLVFSVCYWLFLA
ncbi:guanylate kinase isoform X2 [Bacillus rossius redtenbacheri]|uniref:guanylate kinase isoform X2 n=1 Tax=Bacillus rossius redtenbacheri TaxID=93214 RepID=UPI002FDDFC9D